MHEDRPPHSSDDRSGDDPSSDADVARARQRLATAYHEAGHAVMVVTLGRSVQKLSIAPKKQHIGGNRLGVCEIKKGRRGGSQDPLQDDVLILLAGMVSEARFTGQYCHAGAAQDLRDVAARLCTRAASEAQHMTLQRRMLSKTEHLLSDPVQIDAIEAIVADLVEKTTISGRAVRHHFEQSRNRKRDPC